jgi:hypothetical protein
MSLKRIIRQDRQVADNIGWLLDFYLKVGNLIVCLFLCF